jgi:hypothetical protein
MVNRELVFQRVWNIVVCEDSARYLSQRISTVLAESRKQDIFNEMRLAPADEEELADIGRELDVIADHVEYLKNKITAVAMRYREPPRHDQS